MKQRRKKNNIHRRRQRVADHALRNLVAGYVSGLEYAQLLDLKSEKIVPAVATIDRAIKQLAHRWSCYLAVFGRDQNGKQYMKSAAVLSPRVRYVDLADTLVVHHQALIDSMNASHFTGFGWLASPAGVDLGEEQAARLLGKLGAWDNDERSDAA